MPRIIPLESDSDVPSNRTLPVVGETGFPYSAFKLPYLGAVEQDTNFLVKSVSDQGNGVTRIVLDSTTATADYRNPSNAATIKL